MIVKCTIDDKSKEDFWNLSKLIFESLSDKSDSAVLKNVLNNNYRIPDSIRERVSSFIYSKEVSCILIKSLIDKSFLSIPTPIDIRVSRKIDFCFEVAQLLIMSLTGIPIAYQIQQNGKLLNDICPTIDFISIDNSTKGTNYKFNLHTEDAYHTSPPDFLSLFCIRNNELAQTLISYLPNEFNKEHKFDSLFESIFTNLANAGSKSGNDQAFKRPILFGDSEHPYIQFNSARMPMAKDFNVKNTIVAFSDLLNNNCKEVILESGDLLLLNNLKCLHGRQSFKTSFDYHKRWLTRSLSRRDITRCMLENNTDYVLI